MHSVKSDQHPAPNQRSTISGHDARSVCSENLQPLSDDPHQRYHPIHKELFDLGMASDRSNKESHISTTGRSSRFSISSDRPYAINDYSNPEQNVFIESTTKIEQDELPVSSEDTSHMPMLEERVTSNSKAIVVAAIIERNSWSDFMNKVEDESEYAIEILTAIPDYYKGSKNVKIEAAAKIKPSGKAQHKLSIKSKTSAQRGTWNEKSRATPNYTALKPTIPDRIRINSPFILDFLSKIDSSIDPTEPTVMLRPYKLLVDSEKEIRERIEDFENQAAKAHVSQSNTINNSVSHISCLLRFIDDYLSPTLRRFENDATTKITFRNVWYIFQPGVDICIPLRITQDASTTEKKNITPQVFGGRYQMLWRTCGVGGGRPRLVGDVDDDSDENGVSWSPLSVNAYYIDFDGRYFFPTHHTFFIHPFEGEKDITSLDFYPIRFKNDGQRLKQEHAVFSEQIFRTLTEGHMAFYYSGYSTLTHPCGCPIQDSAMHQETIDSEVIIDTKAALLEHSLWQPQVSKWKHPPLQADELKERHPVNTWSASSSSSLLRSGQEYVYNDYEIDFRKASLFRDRTQIFKPVPSAWLSNAEMVPEEDYHIFSSRVFAFVLRTRTFAPLWVWDLKKMREQRESLNNLQLRDNSSKDILTTLVKCHYEQAERNPNFEYDIIRGKCKGLIVLLHGIAGTGKTSTAESIAAALGKPLFQITCGDLGTQPSEVEKGLKQIFRFAQQWGCVLLLDECEIFLSRRTRGDLTHNALVSVFLRTLELYTGVLFLTTNRVGVLDDAIKSRLTWTSYYPPLDSAQTSKIWQTHIRMLRERRSDIAIDEEGILKFANRHFERSSLEDCTWNGREIQNAFKVAVSLAQEESEGSKQHRHRPKLRAKHFKAVAKNTNRFDKYFREATGYTEKERAYNAMERADDWHTEDTDSDPPQHHVGRKERNRASLDADMASYREDPYLGGRPINIPKRTRTSWDGHAGSPGGSFSNGPANKQKLHTSSRMPDRRRSSLNHSNSFLPVMQDEQVRSQAREALFDDMDESTNSDDGSD